MSVETIGDCTLYLGDCREVLPTLGKVDVVVTDPPYGIGAAKRFAHSSIRDSDKWPEKSWDDKAPDIKHVLSVAPYCAIWGGNYFSLPPSPAWLAWIKPEAGTGFSLADMELCWTNFEIAARTFNYRRRDGSEHPTQKPVAVMEWCIGFSPKARVICDPFMGSGATGVACVKLGRKFIGIEIDETYFDIACRRIETAYKQPDFFVQPAAAAKKGRMLFEDKEFTK